MPEKGSGSAAVALAESRHLTARQIAFLACYVEVGNVAAAARAAGFDRDGHYLWLQKHPDYADAWEIAKAEATGMLVTEARRRAVDGLRKIKFYKGEPIIDPHTGKPYTEHEYSDILLSFLLKAWAPETYGDKRTGHRQMNINVVNTAPAAPGAAEPQGAGIVPDQRVALGKLRSMLADEGLLPNRQRRAIAASAGVIDVVAGPSMPAGPIVAPTVAECATVQSEPDDDEKAICDHFGPSSTISTESEAQTSPLPSATAPDGPKVGPDSTPHGVPYDERETEGPDPGGGTDDLGDPPDGRAGDGEGDD